MADAQDDSMTVLARELRGMSIDSVRRAAACELPTVAAAARAELETRLAERAEDTEVWIRRTFPQRPNPFS